MVMFLDQRKPNMSVHVNKQAHKGRPAKVGAEDACQTCHRAFGEAENLKRSHAHLMAVRETILAGARDTLLSLLDGQPERAIKQLREIVAKAED